MVNYESIYPGATHLLDPDYNFMGYRMVTGQFGGTTSVQTANQLKEVSKLLNQGYKKTEVSVISQDVFEMMPEDHLREINRANKLVGAESSLHAPVIDPSGFTEQGWSEENREIAERQFTESLLRSHDLNPKGNVPVTIHSSQIPGSEMMPAHIAKKQGLLTKEEEESGVTEVMQRMVAVDQESGQFVPMKREVKHYPGEAKGKIYTPEDHLRIANRSHWDNQLSQLLIYKLEGDKIIKDNYPLIKDINPEDIKNMDQRDQVAIQAANEKLNNARTHLDNAQLTLQGIFHEAYKYSESNETKKELLKASNEYKKRMSQYARTGGDVTVLSGAVQGLITSMREITSGQVIKEGKVIDIDVPLKYAPIETFATEKASNTLSKVAFEAYKKFGSTAPIVSVENPPYGTALSSGKDIKGLIKTSRDKLTKQLVKEGKTKTEANAIASQMIGITWDTSHIAMMRKQGFGKEQLIKEAREVAPLVKHVHFNDNFGSTHTDLPPGMGTVPMKEIMQELEKKGFKGAKIFEGGNFFQHFQTSPLPYVLEAAGSPLYESGGPNWNQMGGLGSYVMERGPVNPPTHHKLYGSRFEAMPLELGGEMPGGDRGRLATS